MQHLQYIEGREFLELLSVTDQSRLNRLLEKFQWDSTFRYLANINLLLSRFPPVEFEEYADLQNVLARTLLSPSNFEKVSRPQFQARPIFHRQQILFLLKLVLRHSGPDGWDPNREREDKQFLGRICLNVNNLLQDSEQKKRSSDATSREEMGTELLLQLLPTVELDNPPWLDKGIARTFSYLTIFSDLVPDFSEGLSLDSYFKERTNLSIYAFLDLATAIFAYYETQTLRGLIENPITFNLNKETFFRTLPLDTDEIAAFLELTSISLPSLKDNIDRGRNEKLKDQYDFIVFRKYPLIFLSDVGFFCLDIGFLLEKVSFGLYRTLHNALPDDPEDPSRKDNSLERKLSSNWNKAAEKYAVDILSNEIGFCPDVEFKYGKSKEQIDGIISLEDCAGIIEIKGSPLSAHKYSGDEELLKEIDVKFGRGKNSSGVRQIALDLEKLFNVDQQNQQKLSNVSCSTDFLDKTEIYPILILDEGCFRFALSQWKLRLWFIEEKASRNIDPNVRVHNLLVLPIDSLEILEPYLKKGLFSFMEFVRFYSEIISVDVSDWKISAESVIYKFLRDKNVEHLRNDRINEIFENHMNKLRDCLSDLPEEQ